MFSLVFPTLKLTFSLLILKFVGIKIINNEHSKPFLEFTKSRNSNIRSRLRVISKPLRDKAAGIKEIVAMIIEHAVVE